MTGLRSVCLLLEKHRDVIRDDVDVDKVVPELVARGIFRQTEEQSLRDQTDPRRKGDLFVTYLARKGFAAFQEFCHVLEKTHPHLITCFLMDFAAGGISQPMPSSGDSDNLKVVGTTNRGRALSGSSPVGGGSVLYGTLPRRVRPSVHRNTSFNVTSGSTYTRRQEISATGSSQSADIIAAAPIASEAYGGGSTTVGGGSSSCSSNSGSDHGAGQVTRMTEVLEEPVTEVTEGGERVVWEFHHVSLNRVAGYGFGIAVSGGRDNPHFTNGDPSIAISDVLSGGPAQGKLHVNDRVLSANGVSLESVNYASAVQVLKDSGSLVQLYIKRRVVLPSDWPTPQTHRLTVTRSKKKDDFGIVLGCHIFVKEVTIRQPSDHQLSHSPNGQPSNGPSAHHLHPQPGDTLLTVNNVSTDGLTLKEVRKLIDASRDQLSILVRRHNSPSTSSHSVATPVVPNHKPINTTVAGVEYSTMISKQQQQQQESAGGSLCASDNGTLSDGQTSARQVNGYSNQNLYVLPPTRSPVTRSMTSPGAVVGGHGEVSPGQHMTHQLPSTTNSGHDDERDSIARSGLLGRTNSSAGQHDSLTGSVTSRSRGDSDSGHDTGQTRSSRDPTTVNGSDSVPGLHNGRQTAQHKSDYGEVGRQLNSQTQRNIPEPRHVSFRKEGSVGVRLAGGNETGIYVTAVQSGSPAAQQGLQTGDKILKVNGREMRGVTREEAVLFLLSLQEQIELIVQYQRLEYDSVMQHQRGDSFYIRTHFNYENCGKSELSFRKGDIFHVRDTLNLGVVGSWQVVRIGRNNEETQSGVIPNKSRAEEMAAVQLNAAKKQLSHTESRVGGRLFGRRSRRRLHAAGSQGRSKSLGKDHWDEVALSGDTANLKFGAYERVTLRATQLMRPVVLFGGVADLARQRLLHDRPDMFAAPQLDTCEPSEGGSAAKHSAGIIRLSAIRRVAVERKRHALLDVTPNAVDRLNYAQLYPICVYLRADSRHVIKEVRAAHNVDKSTVKSSRKVFDQCVRLERLWSHVFTATITITDTHCWYDKLQLLIDKQQHAPLWVAEHKSGESSGDDYLFPMTSHLSSPESDVDTVDTSSPRAGVTSDPVTAGGPEVTRLTRSSSDPSLLGGGGEVDGENGSVAQVNGVHETASRDSSLLPAGVPHYLQNGTATDESRQSSTPTSHPLSSLQLSQPSTATSTTASSSVSSHYSGQHTRTAFHTLPHDYHSTVPGGGTNNSGVVSTAAGGVNRSPPLAPTAPSIDRSAKPVNTATTASVLHQLHTQRTTRRPNCIDENSNINGVVDSERSSAPLSSSLPYESSLYQQKPHSVQQNGYHHDSASSRSTMDSVSSHTDRGSRHRHVQHQEHHQRHSAGSTGSVGNGGGWSTHDPYRYTRSTAQPVSESQYRSTAFSGRSEHMKMSHSNHLGEQQFHHQQQQQSHQNYINQQQQQYRPVPPPKPRSVRTSSRPHATSTVPANGVGLSPPQSSHHISDFVSADDLTTESRLYNGGSAGMDSGLYRGSDTYVPSQMYAPAPGGRGESYARGEMYVPPTSRRGELYAPPTVGRGELSTTPTHPSLLTDQASRYQRGSAFELYCKTSVAETVHR